MSDFSADIDRRIMRAMRRGNSTDYTLPQSVTVGSLDFPSAPSSGPFRAGRVGVTPDYSTQRPNLMRLQLPRVTAVRGRDRDAEAAEQRRRQKAIDNKNATYLQSKPPMTAKEKWQQDDRERRLKSQSQRHLESIGTQQDIRQKRERLAEEKANPGPTPQDRFGEKFRDQRLAGHSKRHLDSISRQEIIRKEREKLMKEKGTPTAPSQPAPSVSRTPVTQDFGLSTFDASEFSSAYPKKGRWPSGPVPPRGYNEPPRPMPPRPGSFGLSVSGIHTEEPAMSSLSPTGGRGRLGRTPDWLKEEAADAQKPFQPVNLFAQGTGRPGLDRKGNKSLIKPLTKPLPSKGDRY